MSPVDAHGVKAKIMILPIVTLFFKGAPLSAKCIKPGLGQITIIGIDCISRRIINDSISYNYAR